MENKKEKVVLNDGLLDQVTGGTEAYIREKGLKAGGLVHIEAKSIRASGSSGETTENLCDLP